MYTIRPLVEWDAMSANHRDSGTLAELVLALMPTFQIWYHGVLEKMQVVAKRPAIDGRIKAFLLTGFDLTPEVS
jgi:hypothetical protein